MADPNVGFIASGLLAFELTRPAPPRSSLKGADFERVVPGVGCDAFLEACVWARASVEEDGLVEFVGVVTPLLSAKPSKWLRARLRTARANATIRKES